MRSHGSERNPFAWLSRGVAGLRGSTLIVNLPGSKRGAEESLASIAALLRHGIEIAGGGQVHPYLQTSSAAGGQQKSVNDSR
jgi:molybdopterin biosynthesis enzyme MoaB